MNSHASYESLDTTPTYSVDALMYKVGIAVSSDIFKRLENVIRIEGKVSKIKPHRQAAYITLSGVEGNLELKVTADQLPALNSTITVEGILTLRPNKFTSGLKAILEGRILSSTIIPAAQHKSVSIQKQSYVPLPVTISSLWDTGEVHKLVLIGSATGLRDALSRIPRDKHALIRQVEAKVSEPDSTLNAIEVAMDRGAKAVAVLRGGDDQSLMFWDDEEFVKELVEIAGCFYLALGHAHLTTLADKYSDQCFSTPSAFGDALAGHIGNEERVRQVVQTSPGEQGSTLQWSTIAAVIGWTILLLLWVF